MTIHPGDILIPKPERTSVLQVGFDASPKLNDALHRFLLPEKQRRQFLFRTKLARHLLYDDSDNDGIRYDREIAAQLAEDRKRLRSIGTLPLAIWRAETGQSPKTGDVQIQLELQPSRIQRQLLGGFVLHELARSSEEPLIIYTRLSHNSLRSNDEVAQAAYMLEHDVGMHQLNRPASVRPTALYLNNPHITERTGDIHGV